MLLNLETVLAEELIKVFLESFKPEGVPILMLAIVVSVLLQTVVRQVHIVVLVR